MISSIIDGISRLTSLSKSQELPNNPINRRNSLPPPPPIREELVQKALNFLSHPHVRDAPELHIRFLRGKGLTEAEVQESLNRLNVDPDVGYGNYDPLHLLPPIHFKEFLYKLHTPEFAHVHNSFTR